MKLSLEILKRRLEVFFPVAAFGEPQTALSFDRPTMYYTGCVVEPGRLYIASADSLGAAAWDRCAVICVDDDEPKCIPTDIPMLYINDSTPGKAINAIHETFDFYDKWDFSLAVMSKTDNADLNHMLEESIPVFDNIIMLMNMNFKFEFCSDPKHEAAPHNMPRLDDEGFVPPDVVHYFKTNQEYIDRNESREPFIQPVGILPFRSLCFNLFWDDKLIGRIVLNEVVRPFHDTDTVLLTHLAGYIRTVYIDSLRTRAHPVYELKDAIDNMLGGRDPGAINLVNVIEKHNWSQEDQYLCMWLVSKGASSAERHYHSREIEKQCKEACAFEYEENILIVINFTVNGDLIERVIQRFEAFAMESFGKIGVSMAFNDIAKLKWHYLQAKVALETGLRANPANTIFHFDDYRTMYLMLRCANEILPEFSCHPDLARLKRIDAESGTDYYLSLKLYLRNSRNAVCTAKEMFIHRLTLAYRLNRIKEITSLRWDTPEDCFELLLSFFLLEINGDETAKAAPV